MPQPGKFVQQPKPETDTEYFAHLIRATFVVGFSRKVIENKWKGFEEVFENFDLGKVATWGDKEILDASESTKIVRNSRKIGATVFDRG